MTRVVWFALYVLLAVGTLGTGYTFYDMRRTVDELVDTGKASTVVQEFMEDLKTENRLLGVYAQVYAHTRDEGVRQAFLDIRAVWEGRLRRPGTANVGAGAQEPFAILLERAPVGPEARGLLAEAFAAVEAMAAILEWSMGVESEKASTDTPSFSESSAELDQLNASFESLLTRLHRLNEASLAVPLDQLALLLPIAGAGVALALVCFTLLTCMGQQAGAERRATLRSFLCVALVLSGAVLVPSLLVYSNASDIMLDATRQRQASVCREISRELRLRINHALGLGKILSSLPPIAAFVADPQTASPEERAQAQRLLTEFSLTHASGARLLLTDQHGRVVMQTPADVPPPLEMLPFLMRSALERGEGAIMPLEAPSGSELLLAAPIFTDRRTKRNFAGAAILVMCSRTGLSLWQGRTAPEDGLHIFVADTEGRVVTSSYGLAAQGKELASPELRQLVLESQEGQHQYKDENDQARIVFLARLSEAADWTVGVSASFDDVERAVREVLGPAVIFAIGVVAISLVMIGLLLRNLTQSLRMSSDRLRSTLEGIGMGTWDYDVPAGCLSFDARATSMLHLHKSVMSLNELALIIHPDDFGPVEALRLPRYKVGDDVRFELRMRVDDAPWRWYLVLGRVEAVDEKSHLLRMLGATMDIHDRKMAELTEVERKQVLEDLVSTRTRELEESRSLAEHASRAKTVFLSTVSHEIRTPMNAIVGFTHLFDRHNLSKQQLDYLDKIMLSAKALLNVINDVLDLSKIEAGKLDLESAPFNLRTTVDSVYSIVGFAATAKGLDLAVVIDDDVPLWLVGDSKRFSQILLNLLNNAVKFTSQGSVKLATRLLGLEPGEPGSPDMAELRITVSDTGIGITKEQISRLFTPFTQADSSITRKFGGTGLGLAICKQLVEQMGGGIGVTSVPGQGATFSFTLRLAVADADTIRGVGLSEENVAAADMVQFLAGGGLNGKNFRVLVVEDNGLNQEIAIAMLEPMGLDVHVADNGKIAVDMAMTTAYDLIFMDMQMPVMDGVEATRRLRACGRAEGSSAPWLAVTPIVAMTANALLEDRERCIEAGMDDHLPKPLEPDRLVEMVRRHLLRV